MGPTFGTRIRGEFLPNEDLPAAYAGAGVVLNDLKHAGAAEAYSNAAELFAAADQDAEVARVLELGARRVDIGQGDESWVVLADPEGNEFCILAADE